MRSSQMWGDDADRLDGCRLEVEQKQNLRLQTTVSPGGACEDGGN